MTTAPSPHPHHRQAAPAPEPLELGTKLQVGDRGREVKALWEDLRLREAERNTARSSLQRVEEESAKIQAQLDESRDAISRLGRDVEEGHSKAGEVGGPPASGEAAIIVRLHPPSLARLGWGVGGL